jgi:hypothetical protein
MTAPSPSRNRRLAMWSLAAVAGVVAVPLGYHYLRVRPDIRLLSYAARFTTPLLMIALYLAGAALFLIGRRGHALFLGAAAALAVVEGLTLDGLHAILLWANGGCLLSGLIVSLGPLAVCIGLVAAGGDRRFERPRLAGATAGAAAGLIGMAALHLHCSLINASHGLLFHATVPLVAALAGAVAVERLFARAA